MKLRLPSITSLEVKDAGASRRRIKKWRTATVWRNL
jgi:hypothetical protein